ncbi:hypothetical protein QI633_12250 [Nocardioides sp. QY071]|uniref:hypothetical protein n=1 Tax=Nocardioides sp. QY071 TaxID=3044187 RepID=UPI002499B581|nr:hypothetical protein [Nocardioides sp. QY071]WGY04513.1 hypothetical protein QI633_12250 [Nocardioides sp. QY071]
MPTTPTLSSPLHDGEPRGGEARHVGARSSLVPEALGYLGGVVVVVGAALLADQFWSDLATSWRLVVVGLVAASLTAAGALVPPAAGPAGVRLRAVLWAASVALTAVFLAVLARQALDLAERPTAVLTAAGAAASAVVLWRIRPTILQQAAALAALAATAASVVFLADPDSRVGGFGPWAVGVVWLLLARGGLLRPPRTAFSLGAVAAVVGGVFAAETDAGTVLALVTAGALVLLALRLRDVPVLGVGAAGVLLVLPMAVQDWFGGSLAAALVLIVSGVGLIGAGVWIANTGRDAGARRRRYDEGDPRVAVAVSVVVLVAVALVVGATR